MKYRRLNAGLLSMLVLLAIVGAQLITACDITLPANQDTAQNRPGNDWPMYLHDQQHTAANNENILGPANVSQLEKLWVFKTAGVIASSATVVGDTIYVGSWDGYEYALDAVSGALDWKTYLGQTTANSYCSPPQAGVSSSAAAQNGSVYVGGGDAYWYALDAKTGAVQWKVYTGDNSARGGHYNWSSPLLYNGYAYIGVASVGDCPLVQGLLMQVSLSTHQVVHTFEVVPAGQIGGGIWSSPSVDATTNTIYVTTGTENAVTQSYAQAIVALDASTLTVKDWWKLPEPVSVIDSDFGTTPTLFNDKNGTPMVAAINKNGYAYAFKRDNLKAGPLWQQYIAVGGDCPLCGQSSVSSGTFGDGKLYLAGEDTSIDGSGYQGSVRALDPATGKVLWRHKAAAPILGALIYSNNMVIDAAGNVLEILSALDGTRLASYALSGPVYASPVVSHGQILVGDVIGNIYAFGLPDTVQTTPDSITSCPGDRFCLDVGNPASVGSETIAGDQWKVQAGGAGMGYNVDQFHFIERNQRGDTQINAQVTSLQATSGSAQAGLMVRQSSNRGSPNYAVFVTKDNTLVAQYRSKPGGGTISLAPKTKVSFPLYLQIQRTGDQFQAATSTDGVHYTLVPGSTVTLVMPAEVMVGLAASAGDDTTTSKAAYRAVAEGIPTAFPAPLPSTTPCPANWNCGGIGNPALVGGQFFDAKKWTVQGAGVDINTHSDQFHFVWQSISGDGTISARILSQTMTDQWAKAGLMIRQSPAANSPYYAILTTPHNGLIVQSRSYQGLSTTTTGITPTVGTQFSAPHTSLPAYLEIARSGNTFSTYTSNDGVNWTYVLGTSIDIDMQGPVLLGMAVSSHNAQQLGIATFDSVSASKQAPPAPTACPSSWFCSDVGYAMLGGSQVYKDGTWTLQAGGADIGNTADQFHGVWQLLPNDGSVSARVTTVSDTDDYSKAGVMLRQSVQPGSPYYAIFVTPRKGVIVQYRDAQGVTSVANDIPIDYKLPIYLEVARVGNSFSAYTSEDGVNWRLVDGETRTLNMSETLMAGLAFTSHSSLQLGTATFDAVNLGNT